MNKARMTFRFGEESQNTSHQLPNRITEKIESPRTNQKIALGTEINPISLDRSVPPPETYHQLDGEKDRSGYSEQNLSGYLSAEQKAGKEDTYYGNSIYDDWGEPFGPYAGSSMIENRRLTEGSSAREDNGDPYEDLPMQHYPEITTKSYSVHHRKTPGGWKVFGSVTAAVMTGVLFGFVAMSMLDSETSTTPQTVSGTAVGTDLISPTVNSQTQTLGTETPNIASTAVSIPGATYFMLQYGVFSMAEGASQAKKELTQAGIAAGSDPMDEARVYAGVSSNREEAKLISNQLKTEGVELYVREISLPAVSDVVFMGDADVVSPFFENSRVLTDMLASLSITHIGEQVQTAVSKDKLSEISDAHQRFTSSVGAIHAGLSENGKQIERKMESSMSTAISAVFEYNKNPNKEHMWKVQSAVMDYILQEKQLLEVMKQT
ncbi:SPOR domain-containing protein [Paenibacillus gallinarum]|uniref:SPOR domain-containing protein n=1 Tax=Paenibacillus gallinarum TaxID=2762232 RepID=A0ABR8T221_9BACL|nr:SPOR domain-containing protein [Paenibacillus gallinarum]MBD7969813.1 SPOR domain-containing protein [Paenibacillus gallinarum]